MPGPPPKPRTRRQSRKPRHIADVGVVSGCGAAPPMPRGMCAAAQGAWDSFWNDAISTMSRGPDAAVALRWVKQVDRYHRLMAVADREPIVKGSTGQPRPNPVYDLALKIEASIREDEKQLGIGVLSRLRLGAVYGDGAKTLADLDIDAEGDAEDYDPRVELIALTGGRSEAAVVHAAETDEEEGA